MELQSLLYGLRRTRRAVALLIAVGLCLGLAAARWGPSHYEATAVILLDSSAVTTPDQVPFAGDPERYVDGEIEVLQSYPVAQAAAAELGGTSTPEQVLDSLEPAQTTGSNVVRLTARAETADEARDVANAVVSAYVAARTSASETALQRQRDAVQEQVDELEPRLSAADPDDVAAEALVAEYQQLLARRSTLSQPGVIRDETRVVEEARAPSSPERLPLVAAGAVGAAAGLLLGAAVSILAESRVPHVASAAGVQRVLGRPATAAFGRARRLRPAEADSLPSGIATPARQVAALVAAGDGAERARTVVCCSTSRGAGCSTISAAVAIASAAQGRRVLLVSLDQASSPLLTGDRANRRGRRAAPAGEKGANGPGRDLWSRSPGPVDGLAVARPSDRASTPREADVLDLIRSATPGTDLVVVDGSSLFSSPLVTVLARTSDHLLLVVPVPRQEEHEMRLGLRALHADDAARLDVVLNLNRSR